MSDNYDKDILLIHDGVRPFIDDFIIDECIKGAIESIDLANLASDVFCSSEIYKNL